MDRSDLYGGFGIQERWRGPDAPGIKLLQDREGWYQRSLQNAGERATAPFRGVTSDGHVVPGLFALHGRGDDTRPVVQRARDLLAILSPQQRADALRPIDSEDWRRWSNAVEAPHGVTFRTMSVVQREATFAVIKATMSTRGYETVRRTMKLNETLGELVGNTDLLGEWNYSFHVFGEPSEVEPWGWQLHGHHLIVSCLLVGNQIVMSPMFVGAEPKLARTGKYLGLSVLLDEETAGLALVNGLSPSQQEKAILFKSIRRGELPPERTHPTEGRHKAGGYQDNLVLPYEGLPGAELAEGQAKLLLDLIEIYIGRMGEGHARVRMDEIRAHLAETRLVWMGGYQPDSVFYYRIHSPVLLIEFDHHHGVFFDNDDPEQFHTHTILRTPNGNDYGKDILRQHYELAHSQRMA